MNADENLSFVSQSPQGRTKMEIRPAAAILIQLSIVSTMENVRPGSRGDAKPGARKRSLSNAEAHTHLRLSKALAHIKPPQLSDHTLYLSYDHCCITRYPDKFWPSYFLLTLECECQYNYDSCSSFLKRSHGGNPIKNKASPPCFTF